MIRCELVNSKLRKIVNLLTLEQDSNHPSCSKNNTCGRISNQEHATLPFSVTARDGSHKQEVDTRKNAKISNHQ